MKLLTPGPSRSLTKSTLQSELPTRGTFLLGLLLPCLLCANVKATDVSGTIVNGTWTSNNSPYRVVGNITVAGLTINPGVTVRFASNYVFEVDGVLRAKGTPAAPIVFMGTNGGWQGIYFNYSSPGSVLACCIVSNSINSGIRIVNSNPKIKGCAIVSNSAASTNNGGGIYASIASGNLTITDSIIANNNANITPAFNSIGGGIYASMNTNYSLQMSGCIVTNNKANANYGYGWAYGGGVAIVNGNASLNSCVISGNSCVAQTEYNVIGGAAWGGGIYDSGGHVTLNNCLLKNNTASSPNTGTGDEYAYGGALYIYGGSSVVMTNCIVQGNVVSAPNGSAGGGICVAGGLYDHTGATAPGGGNLIVVNCTIAYDNIEGLAVSSGSTSTVLNSIVFFNATGGTQIAGVNGTLGTANVTYSDVQGLYAGVGNINLNPIFFSTDNLIIVPDSPCINKGNTNVVYNNVCFPPSLGHLHNDMGAHGGPGAGGRMRIETWPQIEVFFYGGVPGYNYLIQGSTNLSDWQTVQPVQIANLGDTASWIEPITNTLPQRFYKLNLAP